MNCYKCNSVLETDRKACTKCGADIRFFKKIVYASNRYYNDALIKAQARDLTGARDTLKISLHLYKKNTDARNLLGLVYYAMGESAEGLKEWVISKNLSPNGNIADRFINALRRNMRDLDSEGHGIKKYNQALEYAKTGVKDLATIQLKKVVSVHSNMTKAYELLALLYIDDEKYDQAQKTLTRCLDVDRGNVSALHYLKELEALSGRSQTRSVGVVGDSEREQLIIPVRFRDYGSYLANALYIILGVLLGVAIAWFVIVPGKVQRETGDAVAEARAYEEEISELQQKIRGMEVEAEEAKKQSEAEAEEIASSEAETEPPAETEPQEEIVAGIPERIESWVPNQAAVQQCVDAWTNGDWIIFVDSFLSINPTMLSRVNQEHYRDLAAIAGDVSAYNRIVEAADAFAADGHWEQAATVYDAATRLRSEDVAGFMKAAAAYEAAGDPATAAERYRTAALVFPEFPESMEAVEKYIELSGEAAVPPLPVGMTPMDYRKVVDPAQLIFEMTGEMPTEPSEGETAPGEVLPENIIPGEAVPETVVPESVVPAGILPAEGVQPEAGAPEVLQPENSLPAEAGQP